jgi:hypothetical protein
MGSVANGAIDHGHRDPRDDHPDAKVVHSPQSRTTSPANCVDPSITAPPRRPEPSHDARNLRNPSMACCLASAVVAGSHHRLQLHQYGLEARLGRRAVFSRLLGERCERLQRLSNVLTSVG